jgi:ATP-binding cassette subfamily C protein CydCD
LVAVVVAGVLVGLLTVAQAFVLAALVVGLVTEGAASNWQALAGWLVAVVAGRAVGAWVGDVAADRAASLVSTTLRHRLLEAARQLDATDRPTAGRLTVLATRGMAAVEPYVTRYLPALVPAVLLPLATIVAIWSQDWIAGLIVVLTLPLVPLFAALIGSVTADRAQSQWRAMATLSGHFLDVVRGLPTLVAFRRAEAQVRTIRTVTHRYRRATVDTLKVAFASSTVLELIATLSVALVAVAVGLRLAAGSVEFQVALTVLLLAPEAYWPLRRVGAEFHSAAEGTAALAEADELLARAPRPVGEAVPLDTSLALRGLQIGHPGGPILVEPVDLTLPTRGLVAVTGPSGCGKSTLLATLRGVLSPAGGRVLVGGVDLAEVDPAWWRTRIAWAPQRPWLQAGSIGANVRLGRPTASDAEVWSALERVDLARHVRSLPGGLDAPLGEDGAGLSAGQRARVALARVVIADRPVVVLDEPTAHLDSETERILLDTLRWMSRDALIVTVAHRQAVVDAADLTLPLHPLVRADEAREAPEDESVEVPRAVPIDVLSEADDTSRWGMRTATLLGALSVGSGVALTATAGWLITRAAEHPPVLHLMVAIVGVRLFGLARPVLRHAERLLSHDTVLRDLAERRAAVYSALVPLVPGRLGPRRGDLLTSVVDDVDAVLDEVLRVRQPVVTSCLVGLGAAAFAAFLHPPAAAVLLGVALFGPVAFWVARTSTARAERRLVASRARLSVVTEEFGSQLDDLEQWQVADAAITEVDRTATRLAAATAISARGTAAGRALAQAAAGIGVALVAWVCVGQPLDGETLALLLLLPLALVDATAPLADAGTLSVRTRAARERLDGLGTLTPAVTPPAHPVALPTATDVRLEEVSAAWQDETSLAPVSLDLPPGATVGVVGPSGSGKSTLAAVLMRFLDPVSGRFLLGGTDTLALAPDDVRTVVGLVDDDPHVFASTVAENVRLASPGATDEEVAAALSRAQLGRWIRELPDGIHTFVGEGHRDVSGGERARIALARALVADHRVLVLDEPTAHLDSATARAVADDLMAASAGRSVVWITHTDVGLDLVDRVVRLEPPASAPALRTPVPAAASAGGR